MLKSILGSFGADAGRERQPAAPSAKPLDVERLKTLIEFFPIGKKLRYYPEFKKEIVFDTLIVAYCLNGEFVYSGEAIERDARGYPAAFKSGRHGELTPVADLRLFQLLVPDTSDLEMTLDYFRRALIGRGRQFNKGNYISLVSNAGAKGVSTVDTEVVKQVVMADGPYAQSKMILLTPEWSTLAVTDQRRKARARTCAPVTVSVAGGRLSGPCTIVDMSDEAIRIRVRDRETALPEMGPGDGVTLDIDLGEGERHYTIKGIVIRRSPETCVIRLEGLLREGRLLRFERLDLLELKAGLLNYAR
ncbi:PilZ domain-containing protein [Azospira restricta]|uniref:PilZ domain-containing protein n=1 Tax=Azospira restricta TaxID=404405 RepID=A0A974SQX1_9RHOO|nr:PilZ domain-containing protein [Azospira restricta]QRJ64861.1 PilZ domain-containing protein [Azospira restricta]